MSYVCLNNNSFWSGFHNQGLLPGSGLAAGFSYENRYGLNELGTRSAGLRVPAGNTAIGAVYSYFGYPDFWRQTAGLAGGLRMSSKITAGAQIDYFSEKTSGEYSDHEAVTFETGVVISPNENVSIGIHLFNPLPDKIHDLKLPTTLRAGAGINLGTSVFAGFETEISDRPVSKPLIFRTGVEYEALKNLFIRGGFSTENSSFSFGLGFGFEFLKLDVAFATHDRLGITSSASLIFEFKKK